MSTFVLTDVTTWIAGHDFTCDSNSVSLSVEVDDQETTTFCSNGWRTRVGGLREVESDVSGFWQAGDDAVDPVVFNSLGTRNEAVTVSPTGSTGGSAAFIIQAGKFSYEMFGDIGEVVPFSVSLMSTEGSPGLIRGKVGAIKQTVTATGGLTALTDLSATDAVAADQFLYATFHVFTAGTTITVLVESDDNADFTTATTRATIGPLTTTGGTWMTRVAGPITDTHYRFNVSAITGSFSIAGAIAIA